MWLTAPSGIIHDADFFETVAKQVNIYRFDVDRLDETSIHLNNGPNFKVDAILLGTGFKNRPTLLSDKQIVELGLPHDQSLDSPESEEEWSKYEAEAKRELLTSFPVLACPPELPENLGDISTETTPFRLYRNIAPIGDTSIAFIGFAGIGSMWYASELESIWATAYLDGHIKLPSEQEMRKEVARVNAYMKLRCPTYGRMGNYYVFDTFGYFDGLMEEIGLSSYRKSWWNETFHPLLTKDFSGLKDEYLKRYGSKGESDE